MLSVTMVAEIKECVVFSMLLDGALVNITDEVEICSLLEMLLIEVTNDVMFGLLVDGTLVDVTDNEDINSLVDNALVDITDVVLVEVCSLFSITLVDIIDVSSVFDIALVKVTCGKEVCLLLENRLAEYASVAEIFSSLDAPLEVTDSTGDILLPDNVLVDITDGSSLLNEEETENVEYNPVLIACEINDEVCLLLDAVRDGVTDGTGVSLLLDVAVKDMADDTMKYIEVLDAILDVTLVYCIADIVDVF